MESSLVLGLQEPAWQGLTWCLCLLGPESIRASLEPGPVGVALEPEPAGPPWHWDLLEWAWTLHPLWAFLMLTVVQL